MSSEPSAVSKIKVVRDLLSQRGRSDNSMMVAFREENKLAFFLTERVARMDPMPWHGSSRNAGALFDLKTVTTKLSVHSSDPERSRRGAGER